MSKHFELMQQVRIETEQETAAIPNLGRALLSVDEEGNTHRGLARVDIDQLAREESLKLVQRVFLVQVAGRPRTVVFAGIDQGNGCSRICAQAARVLADNVLGSVCLVEANFRSPSLRRLFGVGNHRGLTDSLLQDDPIQAFTKQLGPHNLWLLSAGTLAPESPSLLNSSRLKLRLAELGKEFDYVLIDVPPINQYADATAVGRLADGLVVVLEANSTRRESALTGVETLRAAQIQVLGAVLNKRTFPIPQLLYAKL